MKIHIAHADDWMGIYIDGNLVYQNHDVDVETMLDLLNIEYTYEWFEGELDEWGNRFPDTVAELGTTE